MEKTPAIAATITKSPATRVVYNRSRRAAISLREIREVGTQVREIGPEIIEVRPQLCQVGAFAFGDRHQVGMPRSRIGFKTSDQVGLVPIATGTASRLSLAW